MLFALLQVRTGVVKYILKRIQNAYYKSHYSNLTRLMHFESVTKSGPLLGFFWIMYHILAAISENTNSVHGQAEDYNFPPKKASEKMSNKVSIHPLILLCPGKDLLEPKKTLLAFCYCVFIVCDETTLHSKTNEWHFTFLFEESLKTKCTRTETL